MIEIKVRMLNNDAVLPTKATEGSAGYDLYLSGDYKLHSGHTTLCKTGIAIELPEGYEGQVRSRSGLTRNGIVVANSPGTIDSDYRGELGVLLKNDSPHDKMVFKGDRIAQLVIAEVPKTELVIDCNLSDTERGDGGFGHSGMK